MNTATQELYQQMVIDHNRSPKNFKRIENATHHGEGYNPLCGDHYEIDLVVDDGGVIQDIGFSGTGCAISKSSASLMTVGVKGKTVADARALFHAFQALVTGQRKDASEKPDLGKLEVFSGIWQYPSRVKCAILGWHAMNGALDNIKTISTE